MKLIQWTKNKYLYFGILCLLIIGGCSPDPVVSETDTAYTLKRPSHFPPYSIPSDNPLTVGKIRLGRMLFYEKGLSQDDSISCASCHRQENAFASNKALDGKVNHQMTTRNTSVLFNLVFTERFFWDGRTNTLETTIRDALKGEQNFDIAYIKSKLWSKSNYRDMFKLVYNTEEPTQDMVEKAIASFIRTMVSATSAVDKGAAEGDANKYLSLDARDGKTLFETEKADCFHCHGDIVGKPIMTDELFHNNGLDTFSNAASFKDIGLGKTTSNLSDYGRFKTPPTRNLSYTAPYMHDGRIATLDQVLGHYNQGLKRSATVDANISKHIDSSSNVGGMKMTPLEVARLKAYLLSFDDASFIADTQFSNPFK